MTYAHPNAFRMALKAHAAKRATRLGVPLDRVFKLIAFERLLARLSRAGLHFVVKGGLALEYRLDRARTTRDVDLSVYQAGPEELADRLNAAGRLDLGDFFTFRFQAPSDAGKRDIVGDGVRYGGRRFVCECELGGKRWATFHVDVAIADPPTADPDWIEGAGFLDFAGIAPGRYPVLGRARHIAEKLHAYSLPRQTLNSRVKDLPDLALLATAGRVPASDVRAAIEATFTGRGTHTTPEALPSPPIQWASAYAKMADESDLQWHTLSDVHRAAAAFLDPALGAEMPGAWVWEPEAWAWLAPDEPPVIGSGSEPPPG